MMTDKDKIERALDGEFVGDVAPLLAAEVVRLRREHDARQQPLTASEKEDLFLSYCMEHVRAGKPKSGERDYYDWCRWYKEDVGRLVELVRKYKDAKK